MLNTFSSSRVVCRPVLPSDVADVLEFTKFIWDGHDYIKYVWQDWLADPQGLLAVAEYGGHAVALGKVTYIAADQWWLEGLRVDPQVQGLKIGSHIFEYIDDWWIAHAGGALRLMTSSERFQVHHLCQRLGYEKLGEVKRYVAAATPGAADSFKAVPENQVGDGMQFATANLAYCAGLVDSGWKFAEPDELSLAEQARRNELYWWRQGAGLLTYWEDAEDGEKTLGLGFIACPTGSLQAMLMDIRRLARNRGFSSVLWHAPVREDVEAALQAAGYRSDWDGSAYLFGRKQEP
jgi:GNAT superfamily N-acetyltransferase